MAWIKRNLFFVIGGIVSLGLLGAAGFYIYKGMNRNSAASAALVEVVGNLSGLGDQKPSPGNDKFDNAKIAQSQDKEIQAWVASSSAYFQPIASIPGSPVTGASFSSALQKTLGQLHGEADEAGVVLPPNYDFSFAVEKNRLTFAPGGLDLLACQLGEVKAISEILFATRVNMFEGIQRVRVSDEDLTGAPADYIDEHPLTNDLAIITPYVVNFRCFTAELSRVMGGFATASNTFIVKSVNVQPAGAATAVAPNPGMEGQGFPPQMQPPMQPPPGQPVPGKGGLQTILKEQLLRVTVEVELVKLLPKN